MQHDQLNEVKQSQLIKLFDSFSNIRAPQVSNNLISEEPNRLNLKNTADFVELEEMGK